MEGSAEDLTFSAIRDDPSHLSAAACRLDNKDYYILNYRFHLDDRQELNLADRQIW